MGWLDVLGWVGSAVLVWSLLQARQLRLRALNLVACVILVAFNWALGVWPQVAMNVVLAGINAWFLHSLVTTRHDRRQYQVVPVRTDDEFLAYVLRVHAADIARYNPGFEWEDGPDRSAYLVLTGDAGAVLEASVKALSNLSDWTTEAIEAALRASLIEGLGLKPKNAFGPVRVAISGRRISPPLFESLELLGRDRSLHRLEHARTLLPAE